jgi:hypothetical protein
MAAGEFIELSEQALQIITPKGVSQSAKFARAPLDHLRKPILTFDIFGGFVSCARHRLEGVGDLAFAVFGGRTQAIRPPAPLGSDWACAE